MMMIDIPLAQRMLDAKTILRDRYPDTIQSRVMEKFGTRGYDATTLTKEELGALREILIFLGAYPPIDSGKRKLTENEKLKLEKCDACSYPLKGQDVTETFDPIDDRGRLSFCEGCARAIGPEFDEKAQSLLASMLLLQSKKPKTLKIIHFIKALDDENWKPIVSNGRREHGDPNVLSKIQIYIRNAHIIVFDEIERDEDAGNITGPHPKNPVVEGFLDLPFPVCIFEAADDKTALFDFPEPDNVFIHSLMTVEVTPGNYKFYGFGHRHSNNEMFIEDLSNDSNNAGFKLTAHLLRVLNESQRQLVEKIKIRARMGKGKDRKPFKINQIVRVYPKGKKREKVKPLFGGKIDYSHRWESRGHWREVMGIGKNRAGQYVISGATWVIPSIKGPKGKPLVKKIRIFESREGKDD